MTHQKMTLRKTRKGLTLVEIMIALIIAAVASIAFMTSIVVMLHQTAENRRHALGVQMAEYYQSLALAASYHRIGTASVEDTDFEFLFTHTADNPLEVLSDSSHPDRSLAYRVWFEVTGFGEVSSASSSSLTAALPAGQQWNVNEWQNNYLTITQGRGRGQIMRIVSNTANTLSLTADLTGANTSQGFRIVPDDTSRFVINNGKTVRIAISWGDESDHRVIRRSVLIRHREG